MTASRKTAVGNGTHGRGEWVEGVRCWSTRIGGRIARYFGSCWRKSPVDKVGGDEDCEKEENAGHGNTGDCKVREFTGFRCAGWGNGGAFSGIIEGFWEKGRDIGRLCDEGDGNQG